jgi:RTA1 like protein
VSLYAASSTLILASPIFVCATLYLLLARMIQLYLPARHRTFSNISPWLLVILFICSDIVSLIMQGVGSVIAISGHWQGSSKTVGVDVLLAGLALQLATFTCFLAFAWQFLRKTRIFEGVSFEPSLKKMLTGVWIAATLVEVSWLRFRA